MATNKAKRSIHLAQPARSAQLPPVKSHVYYAIAELNAGLEKAIHNLQMLQSNQLFGASGLTAMNHVLRGIRARANRELMTALNQRETANACHLRRLHIKPK
jgi:cob(I)alamin adenosyltransferase